MDSHNFFIELPVEEQLKLLLAISYGNQLYVLHNVLCIVESNSIDEINNLILSCA